MTTNPNNSPSLTVQTTNEKVLADNTNYSVVVTDRGVILREVNASIILNAPQEKVITLKVPPIS